jgi:hypothetical protein
VRWCAPATRSSSFRAARARFSSVEERSTRCSGGPERLCAPRDRERVSDLAVRARWRRGRLRYRARCGGPPGLADRPAAPAARTARRRHPAPRSRTRADGGAPGRAPVLPLRRPGGNPAPCGARARSARLCRGPGTRPSGGRGGAHGAHPRTQARSRSHAPRLLAPHEPALGIAVVTSPSRRAGSPAAGRAA